MSYGVKSTGKRNSLFRRATIKCGKLLASSFPLNSVRRAGLRLCGFTVGEDVYIGPGLMVASLISEQACNLIIGDRVAIGPRVTLILSSDANWSKLNEIIPPQRGVIILEHDCWLGAGVIIMPDIVVGEFAVAGAGSVVDKNIDPCTICAGVPARVIRRIEKPVS